MQWIAPYMCFNTTFNDGFLSHIQSTTGPLELIPHRGISTSIDSSERKLTFLQNQGVLYMLWNVKIVEFNHFAYIFAHTYIYTEKHNFVLVKSLQELKFLCTCIWCTKNLIKPYCERYDVCWFAPTFFTQLHLYFMF